MRPDYCPMANEPCQSMCDTPCSAHRLKAAPEEYVMVYRAIAENYRRPEAPQPAKPAEQEPVVCAKDTGKKIRITHMPMNGEDGWRPLGYIDTAPQPRKRLTDEEIAELMMNHWGCASIAPRNAPAFARAIERAHGIGEQP